MTSRSVTPEGLAKALQSLGQQVPGSIERAMQDAGQQLGGRLVQREIAATEQKPVDQGQYKASWQVRDVAGGSVVGNTATHALFVERGRGPGPVPLAPLIDWVLRNGIWKQALADANASGGKRVGRGHVIVQIALALQAKISAVGTKPRWVLKRAVAALKPLMPSILRRAMREIRP